MRIAAISYFPFRFPFLDGLAILTGMASKRRFFRGQDGWWSIANFVPRRRIPRDFRVAAGGELTGPQKSR